MLTFKLKPTPATINGRDTGKNWYGEKITCPGVITVEGRAADVADLFLKQYASPALRLARSSRFFAEDRDGWAGSLDRALDLFRNRVAPPVAKFNAGLDKLIGSTGTASRRQRVFSELDGEFEFDRRNLDAPFISFKRLQSDRTIMIEVFFSFAGSTNARSINEYGELVFAVCEAVEKRGFQCGITLVNTATEVSEQNHAFDARLLVKSPSEYLDRRFFRFFTVEFFRRAIFNLRAVACNHFGTAFISHGGYTAAPERQTAERGRIGLTPTNTYYSSNAAEIAALVKTALQTAA